MDDDEDWSISRKKPKRRKSCYFASRKKATGTRKSKDNDQEDWCISIKPKRRKSCYVPVQTKESEEEEPITIDKVLGFLNGDEDLIQFPNSTLLRKTKTTKDIVDDSKGIVNNSKDAVDDSKDAVDDSKDTVDDSKDTKPNVQEKDKEYHSLDSSDTKYDIDVSVEVQSGDNEFDDDSLSETIELPEIPPSDEDEDLTDVFGAQKPIITSVTSLRQNAKSPDSDYVDILTVDAYDKDKTLEENKALTSYNYGKTNTNNHSIVTNRHEDLLTPIRYEPVYEYNTKRSPKPKSLYDYEYAPPKKNRRIKCDHCNEYFYRKELTQHLIDVKSASDKIIDKLLQIPVVKIVDVAKDETLDPKLKARVKDLKFKLENRSLNYTLRHCVHCDKRFVTYRQLNNHIVDVILGLDILEKGKKFLKVMITLKRNQT